MTASTDPAGAPGTPGPSGGVGAPGTVPLLTPPPWLAWGVCLALGLVVGLVGTVAHRSAPPWGLVAAMITLFAVAVVARATAGTGALLAAGAGWLLAVQVLAQTGPGGDALVLADALGYTWAYGGVAAPLAALLLPRSWFTETPLRSRRHAPAGPHGAA